MIASAARIYVAGPMDGLPEKNHPLFHHVTDQLRAMGYHVENPAENDVTGKTFRQIIDEDIRQIITCDTMVMLPRWYYSRGARTELEIAKWRNMTIVFADNDTRLLP